ncbi:MAG TPA: gliding motility-associated C-terminal domain-containing protein [Flavobacteriales bacterium]
MRQILLVLICILGYSNAWYAQITANGSPAPCQGMTSYTNGAPNDPIFYYQPGQLGSLTATPPGGTPGWTFTWSKASGGSWVNLITLSNLPSSTMNNLAQGAYRVTITDGNGVIVGCYRAWVLQMTTLPEVSIDPITGDCEGPITLTGHVTLPQVPPHYNLPPDPMIINAQTQITVCYSAVHTYVSDLAFHLKGPASCGSPNITLYPTPAICNSGDNVNNLCFTTQPAGNLNVCGMPTPLTGTFSSSNGTPINWSPLYGCDATASGWRVEIWDCTGADQGYMTAGSLSFTGTTICGEPQTITYQSPTGFNSPIATVSCSSNLAAGYSIAAPPQTNINCSFGYQWTSEPPLLIPNSTSSLNIELTELKDLNNNVIPWQDVEFNLGITSTCSDVVACFGESAFDTELFEVTPTDPAVINTPPAVCVSGAPITLSATPSAGTWSGLGITNATAGTFDPQVAGLGSHTITFQPNDPCFGAATIVINVQDLPILAINSPDGFCIDGDPYQFTSAVAGGTWSGPGITSSGMFTPATAGIGAHTITYEVTGSCPASNTKTINVYNLPVISAGNDLTVCSGSTTQLQASGGVSYSWTPTTGLSNPNSATPNATPPSNNFTYTVVGTDANGCSSSAQMTFTFFAPPSVTAVDDPEIICPGTPTMLNATGTTANGAPGTYSWSPSTGVTGANTATPTVAPYQTTTYTVTFTDNCGLTATDEVVVTTELFHSVDLPATAQYCYGESVTLNATVTGTAPSLLWSSNVPGFGTHTSPTLEVNQPGVYTLTVTSPMGCTHSDQTQVIEIPLPNPYLPSTVDLCPNKSVTLNAGSNWNQVQWSNGTSGPTTTVSAPGIYTATVTHNGCQNTVSTTVVLVQMPIVNLGPDIAICDGTLASLTIPVNGQWSTGAFTNSIQVSRAGTYHVTVHVGSCVASDTINVQIKPRPIANLPDQVIGCLDGTVTINAENLVNTTYLWSTGETTPMIEVSDFGTYWVIASNECGSATDSARAYFQDCTYAIYIPNSFTPDNDGINEVWQITTYNVLKLTLRIYNRWGDAIFTSHDLNPVWKGEVNGGEYFARDGVYTFHLVYETINGELGERSGNIFLLR